MRNRTECWSPESLSHASVNLLITVHLERPLQVRIQPLCRPVLVFLSVLAIMMEPVNLLPNCRDFGNVREVLVSANDPKQRKAALFLPVQ
jgi:hypothetical protein